MTRKLDPAYATAEDICAAAGIARRTLTDWINVGLVPKPVKVSQGFPRGVFNRFNASDIMQARFVAAKRLEGLTIEEIKKLLESGDGFAGQGKVTSKDAPRTGTRRR